MILDVIFLHDSALISVIHTCRRKNGWDTGRVFLILKQVQIALQKGLAIHIHIKVLITAGCFHFHFCQHDSWEDAILWIYFFIINEIKVLFWSFIFSLLWMAAPIRYSFSLNGYAISWRGLCILWMPILCLSNVSQIFYSSFVFLLTLWVLLP